MADNVIRQDVVEISLQTEAFDEIKKLKKQIDDLKKKLGMIDDDPIEDIGNAAESSNKHLKDVDKTLANIGKKSARMAFNSLKKIAAISFKGLLAGLGAASAGVGKLSFDAVKAYADYEQLVGGVDTLFKDASQTVQANADNAFKTTGLSANQYMTTVTSFSASLLNSLGGDTKKAAELADLAMSDLADNANKMGTDLETVQTVYSGLARNQYMLLDNLKLGYAGTKEGAEELVKHAATLDKSIKSNDLSFANLVKSIHAVQEEMGITGTTQLEAEKTITGSLNMLKASWQNLMPALIKGGDSFDRCIENLLYSFDKFTDNAMPALEKALGGVGDLITTMAPKIEKGFPVLMDKLLPPLITAASSMAAGFIKSLPGIIKTVAKEIPNITRDLVKAMYQAFTGEAMPDDVFAKMEGSIKNLGNTIKWLIPIMGAFVLVFKGMKAAQSIKGVFGGFWGGGGAGGGSGGSSGGFFGMFKGLANTPITTVLKGIANLALIVTALGALLWIAAKVFKNGVDFKELFQVISLIGILGAVGGLLTMFSGVVGAIPVPAVLLGLANIALVLTGLSALILAYGALGEIPGFNEFINKGGDVLANIFKQLGKVVGSVIGGIGEGITNSLPKIGESLSAFAQSLKPMFEIFGSVNMGGIGTFFGALAGFLLAMGGKGLLDSLNSIFGGDSTLPDLGTELSAFAVNSKDFFNTIAALPEEGFTNAESLFDALSHIGQLPGMGGLKSIFMGDPYQAMTAMTLLLPLLSPAIEAFFAGLGNRADFSALPNLFEALSSISQLPSFGGLKSIFMGDPYQALIAMTTALPLLGKMVNSFFQSIGNRTDFSAIPNLFQALGSISNYIEANGGIFGAVSNAVAGSEEQGLIRIGKALRQFGENTAAFFSNVNTLNLANLNGLWASLRSAETITTDISKVVDDNIKNIVRKVEKLPNQMASAIRSGASVFVSAVVSMWNQALNASSSLISRMISSVNSVIQRVNSAKRAVSWSSYANGTGYHKGGNAVVNDGRGAELIQMPNGNTFIPQGRDILIPNAPKGMKVWNAQQTAAMMGKFAPTFHYAKGTVNLPRYSPESAAAPANATTIHSGDVYSPVFNLSISGTGDDRNTARKVKRWVKEAMDEVFDSMARKKPRLREV